MSDKLFPDGCMKPMMIIPPETMSDGDISELRANNICVVVSKDPASVRFVETIPVVSSQSQMERAAIQLSRKILSDNFWNKGGSWSGETVRATLLEKFVELLVRGGPLDPNKSQQEHERSAYNDAKIDEQAKIGREEARAEREAKKKAASMPKRDDKGHFLKPETK
jgi:hypothetical protein